MKKMSKILSIILAISMVISMIPMSLAADGAKTKVIYDFTYNYSSQELINAQIYTPKAGGNKVSEYHMTNGFWKFSSHSGNMYVNNQANVDGSFHTNGLMIYFTSSAPWIAMKIRVPIADIYNINVGYKQHDNYEPSLQMYLLACDSTDAEVEAAIKNDENKIGTINSTVGVWNIQQNKDIGLKELTDEEYLLVFYSPNGKSAVIRDITLTAEKNTNTVPMSVTASVNKTSLDATTAGDNAQISVSSVMYSDTTNKTDGISATDFVYTSNDTSMATVDANGKVTVASSAVPGKVDISIAAKENPGFIIKTVPFDVLASKTTNTKIVYDFIDNYAEGIPYNAHGTGFYTASVNMVDTYEKSNGFWKFSMLDNKLWVNKEWNERADIQRYGYQIYWSGTWFAIKIRVPVSDIYTAYLGYNPAANYATNLGVYMFDGSTTKDEIASCIGSGEGKLGTVNCLQGDRNATAKLKSKKLTAGEYYVVFNSPDAVYMSIYEFVLTAGNGTNIIPMSAEVSANDVEAGKTTAITLTKAHMSDATAATSVSGITYESSDSNILTVFGTNATGVNAGTAKVYAKYNGEVIGETEVTVTSPVIEPETAPTKISYGQYDNVNGKVSVKEANPGTELTFTAEAIDGYTFRYWVLGSAATGRYYGSETTVTVTPYANIALTAIYTAKDEGAKVVDLFNYNGEFLKTLTDLSELSSVKPTMIGHTFDNKWLVDEETELTSNTVLTAPVTQAVAQYTKNTGYEAENVNNDSESGWTRNGKLVTYDEDYTFLTWLNAVGTIAKNTEKVTDMIPLAVLESNGNAYMLEYDKGAYEIVEAGILFGKDAKPTVDRAYSKAKVKLIKAHGQFTAAPMDDETYARGYIIYKDGNEYKVIYAD